MERAARDPYDASEVGERDARKGRDAGAKQSNAGDGQEVDLQRDAAFTGLLAALRALPGPCAPPVGAGAFDILYASAREVVVWYAPARDGIEAREVAIPSGLVRAAWALTLDGAEVDEAALRALASGAAGGRWLLALLAQVPGVEVKREGTAPPAQETSGDGDPEPRVTLRWRGVRRTRRR